MHAGELRSEEDIGKQCVSEIVRLGQKIMLVSSGPGIGLAKVQIGGNCLFFFAANKEEESLKFEHYYFWFKIMGVSGEVMNVPK